MSVFSPFFFTKERKTCGNRKIIAQSASSSEEKIFLSSQQKKHPGKTLRKRGSRERLDEHPQHLQQKDNNPHDEAIEFELSISFNGRKYTATRTMQCIVQLRNDLIREMNSRKMWLQQCRGTTTATTTTTTTTAAGQRSISTSPTRSTRRTVPPSSSGSWVQLSCNRGSGSRRDVLPSEAHAQRPPPRASFKRLRWTAAYSEMFHHGWIQRHHL